MRVNGDVTEGWLLLPLITSVVNVVMSCCRDAENVVMPRCASLCEDDWNCMRMRLRGPTRVLSSVTGFTNAAYAV